MHSVSRPDYRFYHFIDSIYQGQIDGQSITVEFAFIRPAFPARRGGPPPRGRNYSPPRRGYSPRRRGISPPRRSNYNAPPPPRRRSRSRTPPRNLKRSRSPLSDYSGRGRDTLPRGGRRISRSRSRSRSP